MSSSIDNLAKTLYKTLSDTESKSPKPADDQATVTKVDGDTVWVKIPGGTDETPVRRTISAKPGDVVQVRRSGGRAWITGNATNPPTDDSRANDAIRVTTEVKKDVVELHDIVTNNIEATNAKFVNVEADTAKIHDLSADQLNATVGYIDDLTSEHITADDIAADHASVGDLDVNYAKINAANVDSATIQNAWVNKILVQTGLIAHEGTVFTLDAIQVNAANITAGTLDVNRLIVTVEGQKYLVNIDPTTGTPSYQKLDGNIVEPRTITADKIVAGAITTNEITTNNLQGTSGWINLHDGTFFYGNGASFATSNNAISWNGSKLQIKADEFLLSSGKTIQEEIEAVENWFYSVPPTTSNEPAVNWTTTNLKEQHLRDIYFDTTSGKSYRWSKDNNVYSWVEIQDVQLSALQGRVATAETQISQNSQAITLKANASDVYNKTSTDALLEVKANKDTLTSEINASADTVKINAIRIQVDGTLIVGKSDVETYTDTRTSELRADMDESIDGSIFYQYTTGGVTYDVWYDEDDQKYHYLDSSGTQQTVAESSLDTSDGQKVTIRKNGLEDAVTEANKNLEEGLDNMEAMIDSASDNMLSNIHAVSDTLDIEKQKLKTEIDSLSDSLSKVEDYVMTVNGKVKISDSILIGDPLSSNIQITDETINLRKAETVLASMDSEKLNIETANVTYLRLGKFILESMSDGSLVLKER